MGTYENETLVTYYYLPHKLYKTTAVDLKTIKEISFKRPRKPDVAWVLLEDILMKVPEPYSAGSRKCFYKLGTEIIYLIDQLCEGRTSASSR